MAIGPEDWEWSWGTWKNLIRCGSCGALMDANAPCPVCSTDYRNCPLQEMMVDGRLVQVSQAFAGALNWSQYVMLQLMHREWVRPLLEYDALSAMQAGHKPSARGLIVLLFWTYFESLMSTFYEIATGSLPKGVSADLLKRYGFIGPRLERLHRILFGTTYANDLDQLGYEPIRKQLENVKDQRNAFMHGNPEAISDTLVADTVKMMPTFQEAWVQTFNMRCTKR
jgi:hypothetical protein